MITVSERKAAQSALGFFAPLSHYEAQHMVMAAAKFYKNVGKKTLSGKNKAEKPYMQFLRSFSSFTLAMFRDEVISLSTTNEDALEKAREIIEIFSKAYPNWQESYFFLDHFTANEIYKSQAIEIIEKTRDVYAEALKKKQQPATQSSQSQPAEQIKDNINETYNMEMPLQKYTSSDDRRKKPKKRGLALNFLIIIQYLQPFFALMSINEANASLPEHLHGYSSVLLLISFFSFASASRLRRGKSKEDVLAAITLMWIYIIAGQLFQTWLIKEVLESSFDHAAGINFIGILMSAAWLLAWTTYLLFSRKVKDFYSSKEFTRIEPSL